MPIYDGRKETYPLISKINTVLALPSVIFPAGGWLMSNRLSKTNLPPSDKKPLNHRLGYDFNAIARYWKVSSQ